ncbi:hypothetical protein ACIBVL_19980 [Streptomyces sp. NPDC049687]|uniref:hypothetical protein n=1 Tax=Streptomyces sp. NPDC049687 TaxID=3365596 RepID=UPI0037A526F6
MLGLRRLMVAGGTEAALVMAFLATSVGVSYPLALYPSIHLLGGCVGLLCTSAQNATFVAVPPSRTADATTLLNIQRQTAAAFGVALAGTLSASLAGSGGAAA